MGVQIPPSAPRFRRAAFASAALVTALILAWLAGPRSGSPRAHAAAGQPSSFIPITDEMLREPDPADWLMAHRTYDFQAFSPLDQIARETVGELQLAWMRAMDEGPQQIRPLVYDGVMYLAHPGYDHIEALDATTGDRIWHYERDLPSDIREHAQSAAGPAISLSTIATSIT